MKWLHFNMASQLPLPLLLLLLPMCASVHGRPSVIADPTPAPAGVHEPPVPTVSTVLANDTAIANQFIDNLNLTDISAVSITQRRLFSMPPPPVGKVQASTVVNTSAVISVPASPKTIAEANRAHHGVAVPMTMEELEAEMAAATPASVSVKHALRTHAEVSTTAKDGITTWIPADTPTAKPLVAAVSQKIDKIAKIKMDNSTNKIKFVPTAPKGTTTTTTTTTAPTTTTTAATTTTTTKQTLTTPTKSSKVQAMKKKPSPTRPSLNKRTTTSTSTTTTTTTTAAANEESNDIQADISTESIAAIASTIQTSTVEPEVITTKETPVPFLVLEPKDADFDLPQDRSPGKVTATSKKPKRPVKSNGKKKPLNKNKTASANTALTLTAENDDDSKNNTKTATNSLSTKLKQKPMTTQIYNYLSREIMPTVGVGLIGLVVTAGIAGYFLNPLGALRRSYEVADRKDDLYHYNNEEYAGAGTADGQSEEEIFGKVIAGMPVHSTYRNNIRYVQQQPPVQQQQVQHRHPNQYKHYAGPGAAPPQYSRYRNVQPMAVAAATHPSLAALQQQPPHPGHYAAYAGQYNQQRNAAQLNPNVLVQKSIASPMYAAYGGSGISRQQQQQQQQHHHQQPQENTQPQTAPAVDDEAIVTPAAAISYTDASTPGDKQQPIEAIVDQLPQSPLPPTDGSQSVDTALPSIVYSYTDKSYTDQYLDANPNEMKRRSQFVVGSVVLAEAQAAALTASDPSALATSSLSKFPSVVLPEHGPRRRRRSLMTLTDTVPVADDEADAAVARSFDLNIDETETMFNQLRRRYDDAVANTQMDKQILKEMKRLDYQVTRLRRVVAEAKDIEQFQSELSLEPKNAELHETLNNGQVQITSDIRFVGELLDDPKLAAEKIAERSMMSHRMALSKHPVVVDRADNDNDANEIKSTASTATPPATGTSTAASPTTTTSNPYTHHIEYTTTPQPSLLHGFLKMLELKSAFGVNVLRSIRPAFDRAVADVFHVNQSMYNHN